MPPAGRGERPCSETCLRIRKMKVHRAGAGSWEPTDILPVVEIIVASVVVGDVIELVVPDTAPVNGATRCRIKRRTTRWIPAADMPQDFFDDFRVVYRGYGL